MSTQRGGLYLSARLLRVLLPIALLSACNTETLRAPARPTTVTQGGPQVDPNGNTILDRTGNAPGNFAPTAPLQCDTFLQEGVAKIDILWVIDNTGSMAPKQQKVQDNFSAFMQQLTTPDANGSVPDYHIGVVTTDMFNAAQSGRLVNNANLSHPWIGPDTCGSGCDPVAMFKRNSNVGTRGAPEPKGMQAAAAALTPPLTNGPNAGFLRDDAKLIIIFVTDAEDTSCAPVNQDPYGYGCVEPLSYGEVDYYARLFTGLKGYGNENLVKVYAFVGTTQDQSVPDSNGAIQGCLLEGSDPNQSFDYAWYAPRYIKLATEVTGATDGPQSICGSTFAPVFGTIASPLESKFYLSRTPTQGTIQCSITRNSTTTVSGPNDFMYDSAADAVDYGTPPPAGSVVKCCYPAR